MIIDEKILSLITRIGFTFSDSEQDVTTYYYNDWTFDVYHDGVIYIYSIFKLFEEETINRYQTVIPENIIKKLRNIFKKELRQDIFNKLDED